MHRIHVRAHPDARVGDAHARGRGPPRRSAPASARPPRARAAARRRSGGGSAPRRACRATVRPAHGRGCRRVITSSRPPSARPRSSKNGRAAAIASRSGPWRSSSTSPSSTSAIDVRERLQQWLAQLRAAQQVGARGAAEVQVGDDQRAHRRRDGAVRRLAASERPAPGTRISCLECRPPRLPAGPPRGSLGQHEADVLADHVELGDVAARRGRGRTRPAR